MLASADIVLNVQHQSSGYIPQKTLHSLLINTTSSSLSGFRANLLIVETFRRCLGNCFNRF
jgi:hypothetical protein